MHKKKGALFQVLKIPGIAVIGNYMTVRSYFFLIDLPMPERKGSRASLRILQVHTQTINEREDYRINEDKLNTT